MNNSAITYITVIGGMLFNAVFGIRGVDVIRTIILTIIGAVVSFFISIALRFLCKRITGKE